MMFLTRPTDAAIRSMLRQVADAPFTYADVGATYGTTPPGFVRDAYGCELGRGEACFARAADAVARFGTYPPAWTEVVGLEPGRPREGFVFASRIAHLGFYSVNPGRVVRVVEEREAAEAADGVRRYGFCFGTLPGHEEQGEERFEVRWNLRTDAVRYDVVAFSRPRGRLARLGAPIARALQRRFARDSMRAMVAAVR